MVYTETSGRATLSLSLRFIWRAGAQPGIMPCASMHTISPELAIALSFTYDGHTSLLWSEHFGIFQFYNH